MSLEGKTVLVTGGSGQLGRVIVRRLALEGAGIFVASRRPASGRTLAGGIGRKVRIIKANLAGEEGVSAVFSSMAKTSGKADILVNCIGDFTLTGPIARTRTEDWDRLMDVNLRSVFLCCRAFLRQKGLGEYGRIINFTAQTVFRESRGRAAYAVAKGGVAILTELLGDELRGTGITANAIAPSIIRTAANLRSMRGADSSGWVDPEDIASEVLHLCGPSASAVNGAIIPMFGGVQA